MFLDDEKRRGLQSVAFFRQFHSIENTRVPLENVLTVEQVWKKQNY